MKAEIESIFEDILREVPSLSVKHYRDIPGKVGLRFNRKVLLTYNSYRKGWLDTRADLGPRLPFFKFQPTHNKPSQYWASELGEEDICAIFQKNRTETLSVGGKARFEIPRGTGSSGFSGFSGFSNFPAA